VSHVFPRVFGRDLPTAMRAEGCWIWDTEGRKYLDAAGGAIVVSIGHGSKDIVDAMTEQAARAAYVHGTQFTTQALEDYADELAPLLPMDAPRIYPVSGGSEATETALKMARAYHLARGEPGRHRVIARWGSYHGNTRGALDASGRQTLRKPYEPWLGQALHVPAPYEYRCPNPAHPQGCGAWHAEQLDAAIRAAGPETIACFIAEPVVGATLGAAVPPEDYWTAVQEVCRRHGVLLIADEVMTGFGRTGRWFGSDHWGVRPDVLVAAKGATSGFWPFGFAACTGQVFDAIEAAGPFVHGFTYSHNAVAAAVARTVLRRLREGELVEASRVKGERLSKELTAALQDHPNVGDVRGLGLMAGIELVADRDSKRPFPRAERVTERIMAAAKDRGLLLYSSTGFADDADGDLLMLGPPFVISDDELGQVVAGTAQAIAAILG
jgi:adenosylmethionine-8-amino-7-oxononanoate aminotransferase